MVDGAAQRRRSAGGEARQSDSSEIGRVSRKIVRACAPSLAANFQYGAVRTIEMLRSRSGVDAESDLPANGLAIPGVVAERDGESGCTGLGRRSGGFAGEAVERSAHRVVAVG